MPRPTTIPISKPPWNAGSTDRRSSSRWKVRSSTTVRDAATAVLGAAPAFAGESGWMDSAILSAAGIPTVIFGPDGAGAHADEEWVDLASLEQCRQIYVATARAFCR